MKGYQCSSCGKVYTYQRRHCIRCGSSELKEVELGDRGRLISYTVLYVVPAGIDRSPLVLGIVEFEGGARKFGQIRVERPEIGMMLRPAQGKLRAREGKEITGYYFVQA
ncbi:MAG: Zn-ribbon domain-containing OB-fold protein [Nitrososphaeria archaeon]